MLATADLKRKAEVYRELSVQVHYDPRRRSVSVSAVGVDMVTERAALRRCPAKLRDPGLEYLQRLLLAAGLDLLTRLAPHDDHDDVLKKLTARLTPEQREARNASMRQVVDEMRVAMKTARPLISA